MTSKRSRGLLRTPSSQEPGITAGRLVTKEGKPARVGERAYDAITGRLVQQGLTQQINYSSPPASPASPSAMPDEGREREIVASSGRRLWQSSPQPGPSGSCLRTCLESSRWYSPIVRLEWQARPLFSKVRTTKSQTTTPSLEELTETSDKQGIHQFTWLYQLAVSERRTDETGCGYWQIETTDDANNVTRKSGQYQSLTRNIAMLPTPQTMDSIDMVRPVEWRGNSPRIKSNQGIDGQAGVRDVVGSLTGAKTGTQLRLEPAFVEWMMGLPEGWTAIE